ncbi:MAG TPA: bifunctional UDP-sugar hydrolase/5'-nucleotidase [Bacteroidales bacterium]|nr:bifunctional UDP-sugar hydrolase/5'-nucleotidase [Bacteroidales bacterium]
MKKAISLFLIIFLFFVSSAQTATRIVILHTNDMHSRLTGFGPETAYTPLSVNDDKTLGGFARIAAILKEERSKNSGITLTVDAGDFLMGTLFQHLEPSTGFQLPLMKQMGYDVVAVGNHEFDFGPEKLAEILSSSSHRGAVPAILLGNIKFDSKDKRDDALEDHFRNGTLRDSYIIEREGVRFGFFSLLGKVAVDNAAFSAPVTFSSQVATARRHVKKLRNEGCDVVICLSHSGVEADGSGGWKGEDVELAKKIRGIDAIISGHTHTFIDKPLIINGVPVVQTGDYGKSVGRLTLVLENGKVRVEEEKLIIVDDRTTGDPEINEAIERQKKVIDDQILRPLGLEYSRAVAESAFLLECNEQGDVEASNLGPFVADAIHSYVNRHSEKGTDVSLVATGVIRENILPGLQTPADIFRIMSMGKGRDNLPGYPLASLYVTGRELKSILEILNVSWKSTPANYCYFSGIRVETDPEGGLLKKIRKIEIISPDGSGKRNVDFSKKDTTLYSITANSYMLQFIGIIKKMSFGLINVTPKDSSGVKITDMSNAVADMDQTQPGIREGKEWLAVMEYMKLMRDTDGNGIPDIDNEYRNAIKTHFPVK